MGVYRSRTVGGCFLLLFFVVCHVCVANDPSKSKGSDSIDPRTIPLEKVMFASCFHQDKETNIFTPMLKYKPDLFLWTGDSVYYHARPFNYSFAMATREEMLHDLEKTYSKQKDRKNYREMVRSAKLVDGTWDDHDYGQNDGGKYVAYRAARQDLFLDFLDVPKNSVRRKREGVYSTFAWGPPKQRVRVIILDTRYHRDSHFVPSIGGFEWLPFGAGLACMSRLVAATFKFGQDYSGDILGEDQWRWLDQTLNSSSRVDDAQVTLVLSSVQVFSSNPVFEGWSHFPRARAKLLKLLSLYRPKGLLFLSGDVHFGEMIGFSNSTEGGVMEVTSSGLTHSCTDPIYGFACPYLLKSFASHRASQDSYYTGKNYGTLSIDWEKGTVTTAVHDENGTVVLTTQSNTVGKIPQWVEHISNYRRRGRFSPFFATQYLANIIYRAAVAVIVCTGLATGFGVLFNEYRVKPQKVKRMKRKSAKALLAKKKLDQKKAALRSYQKYREAALGGED